MGSLRPPTRGSQGEARRGERARARSRARPRRVSLAAIPAIISSSDCSIRWRSKVSLADYCVYLRDVRVWWWMRVCACVRAVVGHPARGHTRSPPTWKGRRSRGPRPCHPPLCTLCSVAGKPLPRAAVRSAAVFWLTYDIFPIPSGTVELTVWTFFWFLPHNITY